MTCVCIRELIIDVVTESGSVHDSQGNSDAVFFELWVVGQKLQTLDDARYTALGHTHRR